MADFFVGRSFPPVFYFFVRGDLVQFVQLLLLPLPAAVVILGVVSLFLDASVPVSFLIHVRRATYHPTLFDLGIFFSPFLPVLSSPALPVSLFLPVLFVPFLLVEHARVPFSPFLHVSYVPVLPDRSFHAPSVPVVPALHAVSFPVPFVPVPFALVLAPFVLVLDEPFLHVLSSRFPDVPALAVPLLPSWSYRVPRSLVLFVPPPSSVLAFPSAVFECPVD